MKKMLKRRSGFTLVELLIVIIIIGILAGAMLLVAGSGTDKAEATKIVSNLRTLKSATLLYYADKVGGSTVAVPTDIGDLAPYMDRTADGLSDYVIDDATTASGDIIWYVGTEKVTSTGVQSKLAPMAVADGLFSDKACETKYESGSNVYMRAR
ncbi:MAG TPA: prepilin-type cleavage/methylation domain-containing protein [Synergistaceae bacterium]|jgi:general secretion pathway protein G|nr:prepilin-type cleavage/methylation domain-containing protein [Synergistaceae bacterium]